MLVCIWNNVNVGVKQRATDKSHDTPMNLIKTRFLYHQLAWISILSLANHRYYLVCWDPTTEGTITQVPGGWQEAKA